MELLGGFEPPTSSLPKAKTPKILSKYGLQSVHLCNLKGTTFRLKCFDLSAHTYLIVLKSEHLVCTHFIVGAFLSIIQTIQYCYITHGYDRGEYEKGQPP